MQIDRRDDSTHHRALWEVPEDDDGEFQEHREGFFSEASMCYTESMSPQSEDSTLEGLVDNHVGSAVTTRRSIKSHASLERCLASAGLEVHRSHHDIFGHALRRGGSSPQASRLSSKNSCRWTSEASRLGSKSPSRSPCRYSSEEGARQSSKDTDGSPQDRQQKGRRLDPNFFGTGDSGHSGEKERRDSKGSNISHESAGSALSEGLLGQREVIQGFFEGGDGSLESMVLGHQHLSMDRLVSHMFVMDEELRTNLSVRPTSNKVWDEVASTLACPVVCSNTWLTMRQRARQIVDNRIVAGMFIAITIYALFGPDLIPLLIKGVDCEPAFLFANTAVFYLFLIEFFLLCCGSRSYPFSVAFVLDLVALFSVYGDTWFMRQCGIPITDQDGAHLSRVVRSNRISKLARITRLAKVARLVPRLMRMLRRDNAELGRKILERKLWRAFQLLDTDGDGFVSTFDLKIFYFAVVQARSPMLQSDRAALMVTDTALFRQVTKQRKVQAPDMEFHEFFRIFSTTQAGKEMLSYYVEDIKQEQTVWSLTNRLSESAAVKVSVLLLVLLLTLSVSDIDLHDHSAEAGLAHLETIARDERLIGRNSSYICDQIRVYSQRHEVLFLYLDGRTYWDMGQCMPAGVPGADLNPFRRVDAIADQGGFSGADMLLVCWPALQDCNPKNTRSISLVDKTAQVQSGHLLAFMTILCMAVLLLIFVFLLKAKIRKFTEMFVNPLRSLADDMVAMSSLEILNVEEYYIADNNRLSAVSELRQLNTAFQSLRSAIRSWSKYVPPCVVERLMRQELEATIGVASCHVTILFCDIDGFEDACRGLSPERVLSLLSDVLGKIAEVIQASEGTLLEFIGDEVLAVFNTPNFIKHHAYVAIASALEIHRVVGQLPSIALANGKQISIRCRCGINTAQVLAGNLGSKSRMKYGVVGDGVNLAARLKSLNSRYGTRTLVSASCLSRSCAARLVSRPVDVVAVKGRKTSTKVYEVVGMRNCCAPEVHMAVHRHYEAFRLYHQRRFGEAKLLFEDVSHLMKRGGVAVRDEASVVLARRCAYHMRNPPLPEWDGVERLNQKTWEECQVPEEELNSYNDSDSEECLDDQRSLLGHSKSAFLSDTRSTGDTLRTIGEGADAHKQPLCFCGWWPMDSYLSGTSVRLEVDDAAPLQGKCDS